MYWKNTQPAGRIYIDNNGTNTIRNYVTVTFAHVYLYMSSNGKQDYYK